MEVATTMPNTSPNSTAILRRNPLQYLVITKMKASTRKDMPINCGLPKSGLPIPPAAQLALTPIRHRPTTRISVPITAGGKKRNNLAINGANKIPMMPDTIIEP
ncbi:hypothetical protein D9M71_558400 [compost metagenome]